MNEAFSHDIELKITARYKAGEKLDSLADEYFCASSTIRNIAKRNGFERRKDQLQRKKVSPSEKEDLYRAICASYAAGLPLAEIAKRHGYANPSGASIALKRAEAAGERIVWRHNHERNV